MLARVGVVGRRYYLEVRYRTKVLPLILIRRHLDYAPVRLLVAGVREFGPVSRACPMRVDICKHWASAASKSCRVVASLAGSSIECIVPRAFLVITDRAYLRTYHAYRI